MLRTAGREAVTREVRAFEHAYRRLTSVEVLFFDDSTGDGQVIRRPGTPVTPLTLEEWRAVQRGLSHSFFAAAGGERFVSVTIPLQQGNAVIGAVRAQIRLPGIRRLWMEGAGAAALLAAASAVGCFLVLTLFLRRQVYRPLRQLVRAMDAAAAGDLRARVALRRADEIGQLERHFNWMLDHIEVLNMANRELVARLQRLTKELEKRVAQATRSLMKRNEELLRLQREMGRVESLAALGRVTGTIAHELGTPLNSVLGHSQLLLAEDGLPDNAREDIEVIASQVHRMIEIIQHYLARTRGLSPRRQPVDLNGLIRETVVLLRPMFQQRRVQVTTELVDSLPPLYADVGALQRVLINLLNNAMDALEEGGHVAVASRRTGPPETSRPGVVLTVTDTGRGVPPELLPKVFDLFMTTKAPGKGTGLGLMVCQEIIEAHQGTIELTSQIGEGTCVRIFLPAEGSTSDAMFTGGEV